MSAPSDSGGHRAYTVKRGDCITSIAAASGHFWDVVWNDPANAGLKKLRQHPNLLREGDVVQIPPLRSKTVNLFTGARHRFRRKGIPATLRLRFTQFDHPRPDVPYTLLVDGVMVQEGRLDDDGHLEAFIPPGAREAQVLLGDPPEEHHFLLGHLPPVAELEGVCARLANLAYAPGPPAGAMTPALIAAILSFQKDWELEETGEPDDATRRKLEEVHGC